jgi:hypothetical protein
MASFDQLLGWNVRLQQHVQHDGQQAERVHVDLSDLEAARKYPQVSDERAT